jgi:uncharacterized protein YdeI (YjbR/CyaY-like superfamily)
MSMNIHDPRIDAYIAKSADFAKPILKHLRELVHRACPDVEETIKWGLPSFQHQGILCNMAAFKQHCAFNLWKASVLPDPKNILGIPRGEGMGHLGRIMRLADLPADAVLVKYLREAVKLNEAGVKIVRSKPKSADRENLKTPDYLAAALRKNRQAAKTFDAFSYSNKKEYVEWLIEAKTEETREKRLASAIEWMEEGKPRNWKYMARK